MVQTVGGIAAMAFVALVLPFLLWAFFQGPTVLAGRYAPALVPVAGVAMIGVFAGILWLDMRESRKARQKERDWELHQELADRDEL